VTTAEPLVVVVGGGFSGAVSAAQLLRHGFGARGGRVIVVNRSGMMARGVAYGTNSDQHVLNVPAGRMSAFEDDPTHSSASCNVGASPLTAARSSVVITTAPITNRCSTMRPRRRPRARFDN